MAETWRVVLASGEVLGVATPQGTRGDATRVAIARNCALWHWPVAEILAPGELTRAELHSRIGFYEAQLAPMARVVDVLHAAAVAAGHPAADGDPVAQLRAVRAQAFREGAETMREVIAKFYEVRADFLDTLCVDAIVDDESEDYGRFCEAVDAPSIIRNIPVPPCPEVSR